MAASRIYFFCGATEGVGSIPTEVETLRSSAVEHREIIRRFAIAVLFYEKAIALQKDKQTHIDKAAKSGS